MNDWVVTLGLIAVVILVLIPVVMIVRVVIEIVSGWREASAAEARKVTRLLPGLGEFTSTDDELWTGEVQGIQVILSSPAQPPTGVQLGAVRVLLADLPRLVELGREYLLAHEDCHWLEGGAGRFEPYGLEPEDTSSFVLDLIHPADPDGVYRIEFRSGLPISSARDD